MTECSLSLHRGSTLELASYQQRVGQRGAPTMLKRAGDCGADALAGVERDRFLLPVYQAGQSQADSARERR